MALLEINNLRTTFIIPAGRVQAVRGIDLRVEAGEALGIVGESGSGKSVSMLSVMGLLPDNARVEADVMSFDGIDLSHITAAGLRALQAGRIGMIFQDPMTCLNPVMTVGRQLEEPLRLHRKLRGAALRQRVLELLRMVDIPDAESRYKQYPHEFSGGMRQRVMIAMAMACDPALIIADEPTTALDVTIQAQILELLAHLQRRQSTAVVLITHDLGVIAGMCSRVAVMYGGKIVETGSIDEIFYQSRHPYTWGLLRSIPRHRQGKAPLVPIPGVPPDLIDPPGGCPFYPRCPHAMRICPIQPPAFTELSGTHRCACHLLHPNAPSVPADLLPKGVAP